LEAAAPLGQEVDPVKEFYYPSSTLFSILKTDNEYAVGLEQ
jgi:hypothetical protein